MLNYKFNANAAYLVAVSFSADSMALLDMLQKEGIKPIVCCVNYRFGPHCEFDYQSLRSYCKEKGLPFEYFDTATLPEEKKYHEGDVFSDWARKARYEFFHSVYAKYDAEALFLAHQMDDLLEVYLNEKAGKGHAKFYGMSPVAEVGGMLVIRPLLEWTHHDLVAYDKEHRVPYSERSEQYEEEHIRSDLRKNVISKLNAVDRDNLLNEMKAKKDNEIQLTNDLRKKVQDGDELDIRALIALPRDEFAAVLTDFCMNSPEPYLLKAKDIKAIREFILSRKTNDAYPLKGSTYLIKEYDVVFLGKQFKILPYTYVLEAPGKLSNEHFDLDFSQGAEDRGIKAEDYPLTIRTAIPSDTFANHGYLQNVLRAYSVWKMPAKLRHLWPVFLNKDGKIVYVPRYAMNFREYHSSVLKLHMPEEL